MGRPTKGASRAKKHRSQETEEMRKARLRKNSDRNNLMRSLETPEAREIRLVAMQQYVNTRRRQETCEQYENRLHTVRHRLANESAQDREHRLNLVRSRLANESLKEREHRLSLVRYRLDNESLEEQEHRLSLVRSRLDNETLEEREHRLSLVRSRLDNESQEQREHRLGLVRSRLDNETLEEREHRLSLVRSRLANESLEEREHRLSLVYSRVANDSLEEREHRLTLIRDRITNESMEQRERRLASMRRISQNLRSMNDQNFLNTINQFADEACTICRKLLYPKQRTSLAVGSRSHLLPQEIAAKQKLTVCSRCSTNIRKGKIPSQAYWNNMELTPVPQELTSLSEIEQRLLSRIVPFLKIIKVNNRFSQSWCKGQVILFAQDVIELAEQLPLPLSQAGLVLVVETRENLDYHKEFELRPDCLENLSLAEFAVRYENVSGLTYTEDDGDSELREQDVQTVRYITLRDNTKMRIRNKAAVLRHRYFTLNSDRDGFYYNLIVLHIPFRIESDLMREDETPEACFLRRQTELRPLNQNQSAEQFAHAEVVIQQALAQAVALNAFNTEASERITREPANIYADDQIELHNEDDDFDDNDNNPTVMPDDVFLDGIQRLNIQQKDLMKRVSETIQKNLQDDPAYQPLLLFITGGAGSGKSFLLKLIVEQVRRCYAPTVDPLLQPIFVEVAALTGVAAKQINGRTLHSVFALPIEKGNTMSYSKMTGERLERERRKWRYIQWLVIDEISMVSYENFRNIHLRLQEFKNNSLLFGGINVLIFGDIMQLPPVKGHWCFEQPPRLSAEIHLWRQFSFCELTINMRQRADVEFIDLLNNLRFGELTTAQLELLCEKRHTSLTGNFADGAAVRIFPTLKLVDEYNSRMTESLIKESRVYVINAVDESREAATYGKRPPHNVVPVDPNNCGGLLTSLKIGVGSRIMLRRNISVSDGLVNGAMGVIKNIKWPALRRDQLEAGELPEAVLVQFDDETVGRRVKDAEGFVSIAPTCATFQANKGYGDVERRMLPIILSWAVTVHKLQGTTLERAVIDLGKKNFAKGQVYVALSRVKNLDGIALCDLESSKLLNRPHDNKAFTEMQRLRQL
ncbi:unnamed protein product [Spodoptera littoralis]|uniref:ATP-dependent DNA helicase n=1 Tax=Spodoptera littoralis TaxID=7109 RepID=A0A9P0IFH6_SPOLI|nr:unnamed protein product [Spodoptera littoralis]CAH1645765.1 unnamed protein product [Spodoptera littoralis]